MAEFKDYYPEGADRDRERRFVTWIEGPGEDLGMFLGDAPDVDARLAQIVKAEHAEAARLTKALPKKTKDDAVKPTPSKKASSKTVGATGKPRYGYPQEGTPKAKVPANPVQVQDAPSGPPQADPAELANLLHVSVDTLHRVAQKFVVNAKLGGRDGFVKFMSARLKKLNTKHKLDGDYWSLVFQALTGQGGAVPGVPPVA